VTLTGVIQQSSVGITVTFQPDPVTVPASGGNSLMRIATTTSTLQCHFNRH
jgi:hypothetical protein